MEEGAGVAGQEQDVNAALAVEARELVKRYTGRAGDVEAVRGVDLRGRGRARSSASSGRTAPASRRRCGCSRR